MTAGSSIIASPDFDVDIAFAEITIRRAIGAGPRSAGVSADGASRLVSTSFRST
jgi:hypothetical protein